MHAHLHKIRILTLVAVPLLGTVAAIVLLWNRYIFATDLILLGALYVLTALGITIGYHRMLTHQGFSSPAWLRGFLLIIGCMAFEGPPDEWAASHIKHHAHSDEAGDPHSPLEGFWHAHMGWLFHQANFAPVREYAPQLLEDRLVQFISRNYFLWIILSLGLPLAIGGWTGLVWGGLVRIFLVNHVTWSVNSVCHSFGNRAFETTDESRNEWVVGLLGLGEGWHNNHHAFPRNAFHGMRWWQFDLSGLIIRFFEKVGLVRNVQRVSQETIARTKQKAATSQDLLTRLREDLSITIQKAKQELSIISAAVSAEQLRRLGEIHDAVTRATHLKKQRLMLYQREVKQIVERAKEKVMPVAA